MSFKKIKNKVIKIALIGCGRISVNHIKAIALNSENAELIAICDTDEKRLEEAKKLYLETSSDNKNDKKDLFVFNTYGELLLAVRRQEISIDLVVLATPSGMHPSQSIKAAQAGLHVCTEKPMATSWKDGLNMVKACKEAKVRLFVVKQNRFNSTLQLLKRQIDNGRFGDLVLVSVNVFWHRPQSYYDQAEWRGTWELDGGALMNQASHYVDLLDWLIGPVETISASIATLGRQMEAEDTAALQLKWKNGALGTMAVTMLTYPKNLEGSITILGTTGTVRIGGPAVNEIKNWEFSDKQKDDELVNQANYDTTSVYGFGHPYFYKNMFETLLEKNEAMSDGEQGLKSLELILGAYESARKQVVVKLPFSG